MSLTYSQYVAEMLVLTQYNANDPNFTQNLPSALDYAQDRITRELNLLYTVASNSSLALTAGTRSLNISGLNLNVLSDLNIITPATQTNPEIGTRNPATIADKSYLNLVYNSPTITGIPESFAFLDENTLLFGPFPDANYTVEVIGTYRQPGLSSMNTTTWISTNIPDLLLAASMVFMSGFMKNFGAQSDDPKMAVSWESQYQTLRDSVGVEDAMRKFKATGYTSDLPTAYNPKRT